MTSRSHTVKQLDDIPSAIDHVGVALWQAALAWRAKLHGEMVAKGHAWYGDARAAIASALPPDGIAQAELVARMGVTKQAVQQLLDGLEADGIVERIPDPSDKRGKRVLYTARGLAAVRDANTIKRRLEKDLRARLGDAAFEALERALAVITETLAD